MEALLKALDTLTVYRGVINDGFMRKLAAYAKERGNDALYYEALAELVARAEELGLRGDIYRQYIARLFIDDENPFSLACERGLPAAGASVYALARGDVARMLEIMNAGFLSGWPELNAYEPVTHTEDASAAHIAAMADAGEATGALAERYAQSGAGVMGRFRAFRFENGGLNGVADYDETRLSDIVGYTEQKRLLRENTEAFVHGMPANNALLVGARGTGKSSCVKALYNEYHEQGLRVVELSKDRLEELPRVVRLLKERGKWFIIFMDDLSFEDFEGQYKHMKSLIEGGVETTPKNVLFYATSNRRHIVAERWSDKDGMTVQDGDVHPGDSVNEKLSLSDRFGLTIIFDKPTPPQYVDIVKSLAERYELDMPEEILVERARQWELTHHGLSGRSARQFINHLLCEAYR